MEKVCALHCLYFKKPAWCVHCTVYILKNLPGEVETATWTDQDELTCTEMKLETGTW
jgi:hypothetical protein